MMAEAYCTRGSSHGRNGDLDKAMVDCTEAIRLDRRGAEAYHARGIVYGLKGDFDRAVADCTEVIRLAPAKPQGYYNRGNAYLGKGKLDKAIVDYTKSIRLDPRHAETYSGGRMPMLRRVSPTRRLLISPSPFGSIHDNSRHIRGGQCLC